MRPGGLADYVCDQLRPWGAVLARRMFSGQGLFRGGVMFGLVHDDTLYFRVGPGNGDDFAAAGARRLTFTRQGREIALGYGAVPAELLDEGDRLAAWAEKAYAAALSRAAERPRRRRSA